jgi:hypothetical protein
MSRYIFTSKKSLPGLDKKAAKLFEILPFASLGKHKPADDDETYLDIAGLGAAALKKALAALKKRCGVSAWGIIDPKGEAADPAAFFFEGASDYIGPKTLKALSAKRLAAASAFRQTDEGRGSAGSAVRVKGAGKKESRSPSARGSLPKKSVKLPPGKFEGWKSVKAGTLCSFFFLYIKLGSEKTSLHSRLGEAAYTAVRNRLRDLLQQRLAPAGALLWMETENDSLFLVPPKAHYGKAALTAALKLILEAPLVNIEKLGLAIPAQFTIALHYGKTIFQAPGKTGTVVSDAVNFVFHLGAKHTEPGRLSVSGEVIPEGLRSLFTDAGEYEGFDIIHSRRFTYSA